MVERSPEKAGVGGSTPSLATIIPITYVRSQPCPCSILFQKDQRTLPGFASISALCAIQSRCEIDLGVIVKAESIIVVHAGSFHKHAV